MPDQNGWVHYTVALPGENTEVQYFRTTHSKRNGRIFNGVAMGGKIIAKDRTATHQWGAGDEHIREWWRPGHTWTSTAPPVDLMNPPSQAVPEPQSEGEDMFQSVAVPTAGGWRAQVRKKDTTNVLWESTEIFKDTLKGGEVDVSGQETALAKGNEVIDTVLTDLFSKVKG